MSKQVALVEFNSRFSAISHYSDGSVDKVPEYVPDMGNKVKELLGKGIKIEATSRPSKTLLEELLGTIPLPEEEDEPKTVIRYGLKIAGGRRMFESNEQAVAYWNRFSRGTPLNIKEVEVQL